jgi:hypothetical protein
MGDYIPLIFLKRLDPEQDLIPSGDTVSGLILRICKKEPRDGAFEESSDIAHLLEEPDAETYTHEHASLSGCYCSEFTKSRLPNKATSEQILRESWCRITDFPNNPLPRELEEELRCRKNSLDSIGRTLLHFVAACRHRPETV